MQQEAKPQPKKERTVKPKKVEPKPAPAPEPVAQPVSEPVPVAPIVGNKETWLRQSGIPEELWVYVDQIVSRESGWQPCAYYPGQNDCNANIQGANVACGLVQTLPCGKAGVWTDPVAALKWQYQYVTGRYGGYPQAVEFWNANHWY